MNPRFAMTTFVTLALIMGLVAAEDGNSADSAADVRVTEHESYGPYLTTAEGQTLYMFTNDAPFTSNCTGECAEAWPPHNVEGTPTAGEGIEVVFLSTIQRGDGERQLTYSGWPLYTFARDEPGDVNGQGVGDAWYLISPAGEPIQSEEADTAGEGDASEETGDEGADEAGVGQEVMAMGEEIYARNCASCHGDRGRGGVGPSLASNSRLSDAAVVARQIIHGRDEMPPFGGALDDEQVAAVGTYIRNTWGNAFGPLMGEQAAEQR